MSGDPDDHTPPTYEEALDCPVVKSLGLSVDERAWRQDRPDHPESCGQDRPPAPGLYSPPPPDRALDESPSLPDSHPQDTRDTASLLPPRRIQCNWGNKLCRTAIGISIVAVLCFLGPLAYYGGTKLLRDGSNTAHGSILDMDPTATRASHPPVFSTSSTHASRSPDPPGASAQPIADAATYWPDVAVPPTAAKLPHYIQACLSNSSCWVQYEFHTGASPPDCRRGTSYVRWHPGTRMYIGVIQCVFHISRYQILMSTSFKGIFLNIGDSSGRGEDHCEFVGGTKPGYSWHPHGDSPVSNGYYRANWGDAVRYGPIGGDTPYFQYYSCDVDIPNHGIVVSTQERCVMSRGLSQTAIAWNAHAHPSTTLTSCQTTSVADYEVHVIAMVTSPFHRYAKTSDPVRVTVEVSQLPGAKLITPLQLVLVSEDAIQWDIRYKNLSDNIGINKVALVSTDVSRSSVHFRPAKTPHVTKYDRYFDIDSDDTRRLIHFLENTFGLITTFHKEFEPASWSLYV